jgi:hypothetical protein
MAPYTHRQGQFLTFIHDYTRLNGRPPAESDMQKYFGITPPSVHQMVLMLEKRKLIRRTPGPARSIHLLLAPEQLPREGEAEKTSHVDPKSIFGRWRITHMDEWDQDFVNEEVEGYIRFDNGGSGEFQFGYVHGWIDHELTERDGKPAVEWSWEGNDEMDPVSGRGWAVLQNGEALTGKLAFHHGDKSGFLAVKTAEGDRESGKRPIMIPLTGGKRPRKR